MYVTKGSRAAWRRAQQQAVLWSSRVLGVSFGQFESWLVARSPDGNYDREAIEKAFERRSAYLGHEHEIHWGKSPQDLAWKLTFLIPDLRRRQRSPSKNVRRKHQQLWDLFWDLLWDPQAGEEGYLSSMPSLVTDSPLWRQLNDQLLEQLRDPAFSALIAWLVQGELERTLREDPPRRLLKERFCFQLQDHLAERLWGGRETFRAQDHNNLRRRLPLEKLERQLWRQLWDLSDFVHYDCAYQALPQKTLLNYAQHTLEAFEAGLGFALILKDHIWLVPMPSLAFDERGRLHNERGPAIRWLDGATLWFWHGVQVNEQIIMRPSTLTIEEILEERNAAVRGVMMERYGREKFLEAIHAEVEEQTSKGILYRFTLRGEEYCVLQVQDRDKAGKVRDHFLWVSPRCQTVLEAIAFTFGKSPEEYHPLQET